MTGTLPGAQAHGPVVIVMGPAGCGKSTLGEALAQRLGWPFFEGDTLHPPENVAAMRLGIALTDDDRWPWLDAVARQIAAWGERRRSGVITCSALKRSYRRRLSVPSVLTAFVYPRAPAETLTERVALRSGHYMPASLVASQLATLEEPTPDERVITVDGALPLDDALAVVVAELVGRFEVAAERAG